MALEGSNIQAAAPSVGEIECATTGPPNLSAVADGDLCRPELSPLSSPEELGELRAGERDRGWDRPGEKIDAEEASGGDACGTAEETDRVTHQLATTTNTTAVPSEGMKQPKEEAEGTDGLFHDQTNVVVPKGRGGLSGGSVEATTAASEQQTKARDQAKRLALEVARLRSSLRATTSELNTERSARVRVEDEWWKKMAEWEEERGCLVASKQEAKRLSRSAKIEVARVTAESKDCEAKAASECVARETAQHKADGVMKHVLRVQDRLVQALQTELSMINAAKDAAQDDARKTREQLRLYVQDFLFWRDRAKRLEARMVDIDGLSPHQHSERDGTEPATTGASLATMREPAEHAGSTQTSRDGVPADESIPEKYARHFEIKTTRGYPVAPKNAALFGLQEAEDPNERPEVMEVGTAAAAWSTRLAMVGPSSPSSRAHFQRSMKAQQAASARLEKDLMKARADLQTIYSSSRTANGDGKAVGAGLWAGTEEILGIALSGGSLNEMGGDAGEENNDDQCPPDSPTGEEKRSGGVLTQEKAGESVAAHVVEGSHLARVLAALLGEDPNAAAKKRVSEHALPFSLRLTDFPPTLQAVFGEGPAATSLAAAFEHRVTSSKGAHERWGGTRLGQQTRKWAREGPVEIDESEFGLAGMAAANENSKYPAATRTTRQVHVDGCGREVDRRKKIGPPSTGGAPTVPGVAEGRESCSLTGAFRGYKAKSSLLQRWLTEKVPPSLPQPDV